MPNPPVSEANNRAAETRFKPGLSGNPGGRPKRNINGLTLTEIARGHTELAINTLVQIAMEGESEPARVSAADKLLDRGWGRPTQQVEHGVTDDLKSALLKAQGRMK